MSPRPKGSKNKDKEEEVVLHGCTASTRSVPVVEEEKPVEEVVPVVQEEPKEELLKEE